MRTARPVLGAALATVALATGANSAQADTAALDPSFGSGGIVTTPFAGNNAIPFDMAIDAEGRIVVVGEAQSPHVIALARYLPDGALDPSFGSGSGKVTTSPSGTSARADGVAIQADGDIVVAGSDFVGGNTEVVVARYLPSGTLDPGFASGGIFKSPAAGLDAAAVVVQPNGAIVVAGRPPSPGAGFEVLRLTPGGMLDSSFDGDGIATVYNDAGNCGDNASSGPGRVIVQPDDSIMAGGVCGGRNGTIQTFGLVRFKGGSTPPDGALDTAFGAAGAAIAGIEGGKRAFGNDFARQPDGKLVEVGQSGLGNVDARSGVARFNADGTLDGSFGAGGVLAFDVVGGQRSRGVGVALEPGGRILVGGDLNPSAGFGLSGLLPNGDFDGTFAPNGRIFTPFAEPAGPSALVRQSDGNVVEAGFDEPGGNDQFALVRYLVPQPPAPSSPPGAGSTTPPGSVPTLPAVQLGPVSLVAAAFDGRRVRLTLACGAASACDGVVSLAAAAPRKAKLRASAAKRKHKPKRTRTVSLGSSPFSLAAGARGKLTLRPSSKGAALLRRHRRVRATATFANAATGERKTAKVTVTATKPKHRR